MSLRLTFTGSLGYKLAARLELPENPKAYVLFAHYFTGNKDITALSRIARSLYEAGIAHTLGREVILITQSEQDIPFDLRHLRHVRYLNNNEGRAALMQALQARMQTVLGH